MNVSSRTLTIGFALFVASACSDSTSAASPFSGRWEGSNESYPSVILAVQQLGDSLTGTAEITFHGLVGQSSSPFVGHVYGDSLSVQWPVPLSSGYSVMQFSGHRSGDALIGAMNNFSPILLIKH